VAVSFFRFAALNHPSDLCVSRDGGGLYGLIYLRRRGSRARLASGCGWFAGKAARADRFGLADLEGNMARVDNRLVRNKRFDLVDSLFDLPA